MAGLRNRRVADIMDRDYATVEGHLSLQDFVVGSVRLCRGAHVPASMLPSHCVFSAVSSDNLQEIKNQS
jgi:hypothetical protein